MVVTDVRTTLATISCCDEIGTSFSTFSTLLSYSPRLKQLHSFDEQLRCPNSSRINHPHYITNVYFALGYNHTKWYNNEYQRHHMLEPFEIIKKTC